MNPWAITFDGIVTYDERQKLPSISAVYLVLNESELLYVGQSSNIRYRITGHHRLNEFDARATHIAWIESGEKENRLSLEKHMIAELAPELNWTRKPSDVEYGNILSFYPAIELEAAIRRQMRDEIRSMSDMLRILVKRGLAASKGVTWEGRQSDVN